MPQELFECYSSTCEVYPVDDDVVGKPVIATLLPLDFVGFSYLARTLRAFWTCARCSFDRCRILTNGLLNVFAFCRRSLQVPGAIRNVDMLESDFEIDGWARWDMPSNDYYDTEEFPEGYTGYDGSEIWNFIHNKLCFNEYGYDSVHWKADFNKAVSGLHSVVSAQVARGIQEKIQTGEEFTEDEVWRDPKAEFDRRLSKSGETPLAMENLYFAYMLFLSAAAKAKDKFLADCASGRIDSESAATLQEFFSLPVLNDPSVQIAPKKFLDHALEYSTNNLWEARMRSRELLRVMNCVQCNKCRLHGKVAMMALSTALQIHLGRSGEGGDPSRMHRVELAALMSTIYKFSRAVEFCQQMR